MTRVTVPNGNALLALAMFVIFFGSRGGGLQLVSAARVREGVRHLVPAVYVFGDSTVDVGNNQYLQEGGKPMPLPYGIDFPGSIPTGRCSNGYNIADSIARLLGFNMSPPAYLSLTPETSHEILRGYGGVNYASGGSGILDTTNTTTQRIIPLSQQVEYFAATKSDMTAKHNPGRIDELLSRSLFLISDGGNDMGAFIAGWVTQQDRRPVSTFYEDMLSSYERQVRALHALGARRFGLIDVPPVGCVPVARALSQPGECLERANALAEGFNDALRKLMAGLGLSLPGMSYSVGSSYSVVLSFTASPEAYGFKDVAGECCGAGRLGVETWCGAPNATYCGDRDGHVFWDGVHGTQASANRGADAIFDAPVELGFAAPVNFRHLVSSSSSSSSSSPSPVVTRAARVAKDLVLDLAVY